jgi:Pentapeptide repeats (8 copies)
MSALLAPEYWQPLTTWLAHYGLWALGVLFLLTGIGLPWAERSESRPVPLGRTLASTFHGIGRLARLAAFSADHLLAAIFFVLTRSCWRWIGSCFPRLRARLADHERVIGFSLAACAIVGLLWYVPELYARTLPPDKLTVAGKSPEQVLVENEHALRVLLVQVVGGLAVLIGVFLTQQRSAAEMRLSREGQVAERFTRATDQLGHATMDVRLGGIYTLKRIAEVHEDYRVNVMEVLCAFVRAHAPWPRTGLEAAQAVASSPAQSSDIPEGAEQQAAMEEPERAEVRPPADIAAALSALGGLHLVVSEDRERSLDLRGTDLRGAELQNANFSHGRLMRANLQEAWLNSANLERTRLDSANLEGASLYYAKHQGASLDGANLQVASLDFAKLQGASLYYANLQGARGLNWDQLQSASTFEGASLFKVPRIRITSSARRQVMREPRPVVLISTECPSRQALPKGQCQRNLLHRGRRPRRQLRPSRRGHPLRKLKLPLRKMKPEPGGAGGRGASGEKKAPAMRRLL